MLWAWERASSLHFCFPCHEKTRFPHAYRLCLSFLCLFCWRVTLCILRLFGHARHETDISTNAVFCRWHWHGNKEFFSPQIGRRSHINHRPLWSEFICIGQKRIVLTCPSKSSLMLIKHTLCFGSSPKCPFAFTSLFLITATWQSIKDNPQSIAT